jgi:transposase-like protein
MIQMIVTYSCRRCESPDNVRNGHDYKGSQKYHGKDCGRYGTLNAQRGYNALTQA